MTELATNAVRARSTRVTVELTVHRDHILTAVSDDATGQPEVQNVTAQATHGRGLHRAVGDADDIPCSGNRLAKPGCTIAINQST